MEQVPKAHWLATRAAQWAYVVGLASSTQPFGQPSAAIEVERHLFGAHLVVLGLKHLHKCVALLDELGVDTSALGEPLAEFRRAYSAEDVAGARNTLEHEEDRVADLDVRYSNKAYRGMYPGPIVSGRKRESGHLTHLTILDEGYDFSDSVAAAVALEQPLRQYAERLASGG